MNKQSDFNDVKMYLEDLLFLYQVPKNLSILVYELLEKTNKDGTIIVNSFIKEQLVEKVGLTKGTIDNALTKLTESLLLERVGRGAFRPHEALLKSRELSEGNTVGLQVDYQDQRKTIKTT